MANANLGGDASGAVSVQVCCNVSSRVGAAAAAHVRSRCGAHIVATMICTGVCGATNAMTDVRNSFCIVSMDSQYLRARLVCISSGGGGVSSCGLLRRAAAASHQACVA